MRRDDPAGSTSSDPDHLRLALLLDQMPVGIGIFNAAGTLFHANGHFDRLTQGAMSQIDALTPPIWCGYDHDGTPLRTDLNPAALALVGEPTIPGLEFVRRLEDGTPYWTSVSAVPLRVGQSGPVTGAIVVIQDINAQHEEDRVRRLCEARFRTFIEHSNSAFWIADTVSDSFVYASPAAVRMGVNAGSTNSLAAWDAMIADEDRAHVAEVRRLVAQGRPHHLRYRRRNGAGKIMRVTEKSFRMPDAEIGQGLIGAVLDCDEGAPLTYVITAAGDESEAVKCCTRAGYNTKIFPSISAFCAIGDALSIGNVVVETAESPDDLAMLKATGTRMRSILVLRSCSSGGNSALTIELDELVERLSASDETVVPMAADADLRMDGLSSREQEVLDGLIRGGTNKVIARAMGISPRTVESHRAHIMHRLNVRSLPELLRVVMRLPRR